MTVAPSTFQRVNQTLAENTTSGRQKLTNEGRCRICGSQENLTRHHLVPMSWFLRRKMELRALRNANANIVPLCRSCHEVLDGREPVPRLQKRSTLRASLWPNEIAFILQVRGKDWLNFHYPVNP